MMKRFLMTMVAVMTLTVAEAQRLRAGDGTSGIVVTPQACEQSIVTPKDTGRYLWLPIEEKAPEGKVQVIVGGILQMEQNVRMAREKVDYYVALDLQPYLSGKIAEHTNALRVCVQNVPTGSVCFKEMVQNDDADFALIDEKYRPMYHHTPKRGWMNDPNGMFYKDGVWNLYYQYNPYGSMWGNMHWGHSTSTDLIHWKDEGVALAPDVWGTMFSGSCVVRTQSAQSGQRTQSIQNGDVVAMYTASRPTPFGGDVQGQCIAFSNDGGKTFTKYEGNPVLTAEDKDFRDPRPFWNEDIKAWNLILAVGQEMRIYSSSDLKEWKEESRFGLGYGNHDGVWECPDLFSLTPSPSPKERGVYTSAAKTFADKGNKEARGEAKWVLICNINPGGPFGGSATQYFVGQFDGHKFTCESKPEVTKWMDYGKDHYATVSFYNAPDNRRTVLAWMSNWQYANQVPTMQFRSANSIPRDLGLFTYNGETYVSVVPSKEMLAARGAKVNQPMEACEIVIDVKKQTEIVLSNAKGEQVSMTYDAAKQTFTMNRTKSGDVTFSADFPCTTEAPTYGTIKQLRLFIDRCSIEAFDADGKMAMTNLVFPSEPYNNIKVKGGKATIYSLTPNPSPMGVGNR